MISAHKTHRRALTSDFPCKPAIIEPKRGAIRERDATLSKTCALCGATKPLTAFAADRWNPGNYNRRCRACIGAIPPPRDDEAGGEVTFESLTDDARRLKGQSAVHWRGRTKITAVYDCKTDTMHYAVSGWPCLAADLQYIFRLIESGQPVRGLP